ncbi:LysR substrate binding domain protein [Paenibacillus sp. P1XP2]|nr:LysR substrate binding domain protein [Paenibacillus sp. P1XP2]
MESRYLNAKPAPQHFSVSTQHYAFAVNAFVHLVREYGQEEYELALRETKTHEIIQDVKTQRSEIGILYLNEFNSKVINRLLKDANLKFTSLFTAKPHIFISIHNPLAKQSIVTIDQLEAYPYLSFEQGEYNSFHFSEEILSTLSHPKSIRVNDRATLFNLLIGLNGYTISTGVLSADLNGNEIIPVPLDCRNRSTWAGFATRTLPCPSWHWRISTLSMKLSSKVGLQSSARAGGWFGPIRSGFAELLGGYFSCYSLRL